jgi:hypothetical protein
VLFIGRVQEKTALFRTERRRDANSDSYPWIVKTTGVVNHFYVYAVDAEFGPFFLKFRSYFPYNLHRRTPPDPHPRRRPHRRVTPGRPPRPRAAPSATGVRVEWGHLIWPAQVCIGRVGQDLRPPGDAALADADRSRRVRGELPGKQVIIDFPYDDDQARRVTKPSDASLKLKSHQRSPSRRRGCGVATNPSFADDIARDQMITRRSCVTDDAVGCLSTASAEEVRLSAAAGIPAAVPNHRYGHRLTPQLLSTQLPKPLSIDMVSSSGRLAA